jgi:hypothetical protein
MSLYYLSKDYITNNIFETKNNNKTVKNMLLNSSWIQYTFIQHYVIQFVSVLWQVGDFHWIFRVPPPIKQTAAI